MVLGISDIPILLVIAGVGFIFIAIVREVSGYIKTSIDEKKAKILGIAGIILLASGLITAATGVFQPPEIKPTPTPPVTPTPTPTPTPSLIPSQTPTLQIKITSPEEGDEVPISTIVSGTFSGELTEGQYMWVVINPHPSPGQWWPQGGRIDPWKGQWNVPAWLGREKEDIGKEFDIAVILVDERDDQYYWNYLKTGQETGSYPPIPLPASTMIIDRITVVRK